MLIQDNMFRESWQTVFEGEMWNLREVGLDSRVKAAMTHEFSLTADYFQHFLVVLQVREEKIRFGGGQP